MTHTTTTEIVKIEVFNPNIKTKFKPQKGRRNLEEIIDFCGRAGTLLSVSTNRTENLQPNFTRNSNPRRAHFLAHFALENLAMENLEVKC